MEWEWDCLWSSLIPRPLCNRQCSSWWTGNETACEVVSFPDHCATDSVAVDGQEVPLIVTMRLTWVPDFSMWQTSSRYCWIQRNAFVIWLHSLVVCVSDREIYCRRWLIFCSRCIYASAVPFYWAPSQGCSAAHFDSTSVCNIRGNRVASNILTSNSGSSSCWSALITMTTGTLSFIPYSTVHQSNSSMSCKRN